MTGAPRKEHEDGRRLAADDPRHGSYNGYHNLGCRCDDCRTANTDYMRAGGFASYKKDACACGRDKTVAAAKCRKCENASRAAQHGTESRYCAGCRCVKCRAASALARRRRRKPVENPSRHGLDWVYRAGCRCDACREAWKLRQREIAARRTA